MKYKLLIADDEHIVLESIQYIIRNNFNTIECLTAKSGRDAIEKSQIFKPDIVFMDIRMPGITGIDAIEQIKKTCIDTIFIIITAYDQFDFALEALKLGVLEYILKPVNKDKVIQVLNKAISFINIEREKLNTELELKEKIGCILPILENSFIYSIVLTNNKLDDFSRYKSIFNIKANGGFILTIQFDNSDLLQNSYLNQSFYEYTKNIFKSKYTCIVGPLILNQIVIFIPTELTQSEYKLRLEIINNINTIYNTLKVKLNSDFTIGIGKHYDSAQKLFMSYEESQKAIQHSKNSGVIHIMDIPIETENIITYSMNDEKLLNDSISSGDIINSIQTFCNIFKIICFESNDNSKNINGRVLELMVLVHQSAYKYGLKNNDFDALSYINKILSFNNKHELKVWCINRIELIINEICNLKESKVNHLIVKAKNFIYKNFDKDITLEDVAKEVCITPHYFSRLFKDETNENFIDFITSIRIEKAKDLLINSEYSIKEISYKIGYTDPNYFSRIFKKTTSYSPSEFKSQI